MVDDDVDPTELSEVVWAMVTRSRPAQSIDILRETWSTYLDPSQNPPDIRPWGSKCIINACKEYKYIKTFSRRSLLKKAGTIRVVIGPAIDPAGLTPREVNERAQQWIEAKIAEIVAQPGGQPR